MELSRRILIVKPAHDWFSSLRTEVRPPADRSLVPAWKYIGQSLGCAAIAGHCCRTIAVVDLQGMMLPVFPAGLLGTRWSQL